MELNVARDKIVTNIEDVHSDIWMTQLAPGKKDRNGTEADETFAGSFWGFVDRISSHLPDGNTVIEILVVTISTLRSLKPLFADPNSLPFRSVFPFSFLLDIVCAVELFCQ